MQMKSICFMQSQKAGGEKASVAETMKKQEKNR
jgi:hypothetical protein